VDAGVARRRARLRERRLDPVGDEGEGGVAGGRAQFQRLALVVGEDEDGHVERRLVAPPALERLVAPRALLAAEHLAAHDHRALAAEMLLEDLVVDGALLAAFAPVLLAPGPDADRPLVQLVAAGAERLLGGWIGARAEPVEGHGDVEGDVLHAVETAGGGGTHRCGALTSASPAAVRA
jgi:hypothetical protein